MRVLVLTQEFPSDSNPQACNFILEQVRELKKYAEIIVIAPVCKYLPLKRYSEFRNASEGIPYKVVLGNITVYRPRYCYMPWVLRLLNIYLFIGAVNKILKSEKIDIIHAHFAHAAGYAGAILKKKFKIPLIVNVHGSDINRYALSKEGGMVVKQRVVVALEQADAIIAVSKDLAEKTVMLGDFSNKLHVIYNGIPLDIFSPANKTEARKQANFPQYKKILLFAGNIIDQKGVFDLLDALSILSRWRDDLLAVFAGKDGTNGRFLKQIKYASNILYCGEVPHERISLYMRAADLLVHPSYSEGFGLVIAESLACGLPVVATRVGAVPEIITSDGMGILIEPGNSKVLADAIEECLSRRFDHNLMQNCAEKFSISKKVFEIIKLYKSLI